MMRTVLASAALVAAVRAGSCGDAVVINKCSYPVHLSNTPSADGGYSNVDKTLSPGSHYSQTYTELTNGNGWSLKLSKTAGAFQDNILQYEYTYHNDGIIWYDLSEVNGNPWDGNWEITATKGCSPRQAAYRYATDDAYGMQSCAADASITVTLCSGDSGSGSTPPPPASSPASSPAASSPATSAAPTTSEAPTSTQPWAGHHTWDGAAVEAPAAKYAGLKEAKDKALRHKPKTTMTTTLSTTASPAWDGPVVTVTNVNMATVTQYVTATAEPAKRHVHHARHPHRR